MTVQTRSIVVLAFSVWFDVAFAIPHAKAAQTPDVLRSTQDLRRCVLPMEDLASRESLWGVAVSVIPAFDPEWMLTMKHIESDSVEVTLHEVTGVSLFKRFEDSSELQGVTCGAAKSKIPVTERSWTSRSCRGLNQLMKDFEKQKWPALPNTGLIFDATTIEARVETMKEMMRVEVQSTSTFDKKSRDEHPLADWVWSVRRLLERNCTTK